MAPVWKTWLPFIALTAVFVAVTILNFWRDEVGAAERANMPTSDLRPLYQKLNKEFSDRDDAIMELFRRQAECNCHAAEKK